jgi:hypothetical protein
MVHLHFLYDLELLGGVFLLYQGVFDSQFDHAFLLRTHGCFVSSLLRSLVSPSGSSSVLTEAFHKTGLFIKRQVLQIRLLMGLA